MRGVLAGWRIGFLALIELLAIGCGDNATASAPLLTITSPTPRAELDNGSAINVTGIVSGSAPTVIVNGTPASVTSGGFSQSVPAMFGVVSIDVTAVDGDSAEARAALDVMVADSYAPIGGSMPTVTSDDGVTTSLGTNALGGTDVAVAKIVGQLDFESAVPNGGQVSTGNLDLRVTAIHPTGVTVHTSIVDGGVVTTVAANQFTLDTAGSMTVSATTYSLNGSVAYMLDDVIEVSVGKESGQSLQVAAQSATVTIASSTPNFADTNSNDIYNLPSSSLHVTLSNTASAAFFNVLLDAAPTTLRALLSSFDTSVSAVGSGVTAAATTTTLACSAVSNNIDVHQQTSVATPLPSIAPSRGVASMARTGAAPAVDGRWQAAIDLDVLNALLHHRWSTGGLNRDGIALVPASQRDGTTAALQAGLAPVLRPPHGDESSTLILSIGELELDVQRGGNQIRFLLGVDVDVGFAVNANRLVPVLGPPRTRAAMIANTGKASSISDTAIASELATVFEAELRAMLIDTLTITLPVPQLQTATVELANPAAPTFVAGALRVSADLVSP